MGRSCLRKCARCSAFSAKNWLKKNKLLIGNLAGVLIGIVLGVIIKQAANPSPKDDKAVFMWIGIAGDVFLRLLKLLLLPLIVSCLITSVAELDAKASGKIGLVTLAYIAGCKPISALIAIVLTVVIHPGQLLNNDALASLQQRSTYSDSFADLLRNIFPENIIQACFQQQKTEFDVTQKIVNATINGTYQNVTVESVSTRLAMISGTNMLGVVTFSFIFGMGTYASGKRAKPILDFFNAVNQVTMQLMTWVIWFSPVGIASLIAAAILKIEDFEKVGTTMGLFIVTFLIGQFLQQMVVFPLIYFIVQRKNPYKFHYTILEVLTVVFVPPSTAVGLPYMFRSFEENKSDPRVTKFVLPVGATINKDGSLCFILTSAVFIAQTYGLELDAGQLIVAGLAGCIMSMCVGAVPSSSILVLMMVTATMNIPFGADRLALLMAFEWFTDRIRTTTNSLGICHAVPFVEKLCRLERIDSEKDREEVEGEMAEALCRETNNPCDNSREENAPSLPGVNDSRV